MKSLYLLINLGAVIIPFIYSFHKKIRFNRYFLPAFLAIIIVALPFIIWDIYFTKLGVWGFNEKYLLGIKFSNLPIEEILFFICIPFSCLFTYFVFRKYQKQSISGHRHIWAYVAFILLIIIALYNLEKQYTFVAFMLSAFSLLFFQLFFKRFLGIFLITFSVLLIPFLIVNGILTGTGIENEVVWYTNAENLGIRILTIPIEDFVYAFAMIALNVMVFEKLRGYAKA